MLLYSIFNKPFEMFGAVFPASKDDYDHICQFSQKLPQLLESDLLKPMKVTLWEGGLERVAEAFQYLEDGKVKAEKLVIKV
jgi:NADPH-dependent curcumin reductase CurA